MKKKFNSIGLIGRQRSGESITTLTDLISHLQQKHYDLILEEETANLIGNKSLPSYPRNEFGKHCDLAIVVGGDGSILNAAKAVVDHNVPVLGINRGRLGFLADIHPNELTSRLDAVLSGEFVSEQRFLLDVSVLHDNTTIHSDAALNDVVLMPGDYAHMIEFDIFIDDQLVCGERADGQIIATPTGSTAYALSGGGPILHPSLDAIVMVPMFSHTLSARPIVINSNSKIDILIAEGSETSPRISCDGQDRLPIAPGDILHVTKKATKLTLLHPINYNYFTTLREKLHWQTKL